MNETFASGGQVSIISRFLCQTMKQAGVNADSSCRESLELDRKATSEFVANPHQTLYYDVLVVDAFEKGMISKFHDRHEMALKAQKFQTEVLNETYHDFPVTCPSKEEHEAFLNYSLAMEARLLPEFYNTSDGYEDHVASFWKNVQKNKFCWLDTKSVLEQDQWKTFFERYSETRWKVVTTKSSAPKA
mmetsp:Transcript_23893/g.42405  ORF Transcript_23893/g.42405 Transcript_23893/m.42405 type:complete len:188 (+) Transcript_23893:1-564(+)